MKIIRNTMSVSDIYNMMKSGELTINREYQRSGGLWPPNARSYFIDTVLNEFPFPKIVIRQFVDLKSKKSKREIIDGQQRLTTLRDFIDNKFKLTSVSKKFSGQFFNDLEEDIQSVVLTYEISIDSVLTASTEEILEIFRRINSYTLPLNTSEKRNATYQGEFKWFINNLTEIMTPFFKAQNILSLRDISRMMDADLITECCQLINEGIQNRSAKKLDKLYEKNDKSFISQSDYEDKILGSFKVLKDDLSQVFQEVNIPSYLFYSLMGALLHNKFGIPDSKGEISSASSNLYIKNPNQTSITLLSLFAEVSEKNENGKYPKFVKASIATTHSYKNRMTRLNTILNILQE